MPILKRKKKPQPSPLPPEDVPSFSIMISLKTMTQLVAYRQRAGWGDWVGAQLPPYDHAIQRLISDLNSIADQLDRLHQDATPL